MMEYLLSALLGGLLGSILGAIIVLHTTNQNRRQQYYLNWINSISEHNWKLLERDLDPGLGIKDVGLEVRVVCYQHLNLLLLAWLHRKIIEKDGSFSGWKNWAQAIIKGAQIEGREKFSYAYSDILTHHDMYPKSFIEWLDKKIGLRASKFKRPKS